MFPLPIGRGSDNSSRFIIIFGCFPKFSLIFIVGVPGKPRKFHNICVCQSPSKAYRVFQDYFFRFNRFLCSEILSFAQAYLLAIEPRCLNALFRSLMEIRHFLFRLFKSFSYLLLRQKFDNLVRCFNVNICNIISSIRNGLRDSGFISISINIAFFQKHKRNALVHQFKISFNALISVSTHVTQTLHYMEVMDSPLLKKCFIGCIPTTDYELNGIYVGSVSGQKFFLHEIEYDAVYAGEIMQEEDTFWSENIVKRRCPPPSHIGSLDNKVVLEYHKTPLTEKNVPEVTLSYEDAQTVLDSLVSLEDDYATTSKNLEKIKESRDAMRTEVRKLAMGATKVAFESKDKRKRVFISDCPTKGSARVDSKKLAEFFPEVYQKVVTQGTPTLRFKLTYSENTDPAQ